MVGGPISANKYMYTTHTDKFDYRQNNDFQYMWNLFGNHFKTAWGCV